jgi:predicted RNA methylase
MKNAMQEVHAIKAASAPRYEGYSNSATYCASLYIGQEAKIHHNLGMFANGAGEVDPVKLASYFTSVIVVKDDDERAGVMGRRLFLSYWVEGEVNWVEIAAELSETLSHRRSEPDIAGPVSMIVDQVGSALESIEVRLGGRAESSTSSLQDPSDLDLGAIGLLSEAEVVGNVVKFHRQLDRSAYAKVDRILRAIGGKWNRRAGGHVFANDPADLIDNVIQTGTYEKPDNHGFFPTPKDLVLNLMREAGIAPGMCVLEPSAGIGNIAVELAAITGHENVTTVELQQQNVDVLRTLGFDPVTGDFMDFKTDRRFDAICMNPPFAKQADIKHVLHAWDLLAPGGKLTSIMSGGAAYRQDRRTAEFRDFVRVYGRYYDNPEGSFRSSGTLVRTITVVLHKPL